MNKTKVQRFLIILALVAGLCLLQPRLNAQQQDRPEAQQQQPDTSSQPSTMDQASDPQIFIGKIAKSDGKFVLKDNVTKATYVLDDQEKAKQFEGQAVKVTGTLDAQTNTIRISSIAPES